MTICAKTLSPVTVPFKLSTGFNDRSEAFRNLLDAINTEGGDAFSASGTEEVDIEYTTIEDDERRLRLFVWHDLQADSEIRFHVYPNSVAIAETCLKDLDEKDAGKLEEQVQTLSIAQVRESFRRFIEALKTLTGKISHPLLDIDSAALTRQGTPRIFWTSRALLLTPRQLKDEQTGQLVTDWLAHTERPEEASAIIEGTRDYSMTWLNYVLVSDDIDGTDERIDAMILAQYCYTAQDSCNLKLKEAIADAYRENHILEAREGLEQSRIAARLHQVAVNEQMNYLTRRKRKLLDEIFKSWEYEELVENGRRMIEICSDRLEEANRRRAVLSSKRTDFLLAAISLFTVFELFLFLTQFSRELVSQPILEYQDEGPSFFLSRIARLDAAAPPA